MNKDKLSARLAAVAKYVPQGSRVADIGSDHAYLPIYLAKNSGIPFAIAGEVAAGPFHSAEQNVLAEGLSGVISVRMGDGLEVIKPNEVNCITIAGMGGTLIASILEKGKEKLGSVTRLILQPNIGANSIRKWLLNNSWVLLAEEILEEDGKIYEILVAEHDGEPLKPYESNLEAGLLFGPYLAPEQNEVFKKKWLGEKRNWQRIYQQLEQAAPTPEVLEKKQELLHKIQLAEEVIGNENT
ncbi:tRNA (adenine(22)-N(1))-methyltransferase [Bacillus rubiinfantis]|uniref:tRNA (adenine(22)-N(1))-methyltransferase n=1 Tax=Bacillus rubiinfantis TaxID=1499680 RepID=UPI0005A9499D|nr:tRNA (adenine(22)-N(1))-methyltransferase TrmK [Bacillus rubiinfantis]